MKIKVNDRDLPDNSLVNSLVALNSQEFRAVIKAAVSMRRTKRALAKAGIL